jgi:hypothetical protein
MSSPPTSNRLCLCETSNPRQPLTDFMFCGKLGDSSGACQKSSGRQRSTAEGVPDVGVIPIMADRLNFPLGSSRRSTYGS